MDEPDTAPVTTPVGEPAAERDALGLDRLVFFSDAVYAIAITLLALEIRLPPLAETVTEAQLTQALLAIWPQYFSFALSFLVIGQLWVSHHRRFRFITGYNRRLIQINLLLLLTIAFLPFPTAVIADYGDLGIATALYAASMVVPGLIMLWLWWYVQRAGLVRADLSPAERRAGWVGTTARIAVFALTIPVAFFNADLAKYLWLLLIPAMMLAH